ncbi:hypothetical protein [Carnobacterium mobile]|uniref:hypothetical protein n=1 Tax=Carnobacterium mobile TaxID=2750 RepID=UPI000557B2EA|nr:hypothetical protein [Carnobacterium mobile]
MIVKVKDMPVFYDGERHEAGEEFEIKKEDHNDALFSVVKETSDIDKPEDVSKLKKEELQALLDEKRIEYEAAATKNDLLALLEAAK